VSAKIQNNCIYFTSMAFSAQKTPAIWRGGKNDFAYPNKA
jgi:hypothetical protein